MPYRRGSPICPRSPSCHKPTSCAYLITDQSWSCFTSDAPRAITELLPVTNVPLQVCHACGSRVSCCCGPAASDCCQGVTRSYRALSFRTCTSIGSAYALGGGSSRDLRRFFTAWFSSTDSIDPIHQTLHANGASIPAANRLYQGRTDVIDLIHRGPVSLPTSGSRSISKSPEIPCGGRGLLGSSQVTAL